MVLVKNMPQRCGIDEATPQMNLVRLPRDNHNQEGMCLALSLERRESVTICPPAAFPANSSHSGLVISGDTS